MDRNESLFKFEQYLRRRFPERRTPIDYVSDVRQFMAVCPKPWRDVTLHDIDAFVDQQRANGLQLATVRRRVAALKTFFDFLAEDSGDLSWPNPVRFKRHAGMPITSLGKLLGHAQITTTQIYTAGADPELAQAYQTAMSRLVELSPTPPSPPPVAPPNMTLSSAPVAPPTPVERVETLSLPLPKWDTWARHLPVAIRPACLEYVQRRLPTWSAPRRRHRVQSVLNDLVHLWDGFLAHRPLTRPGELSLKDLWAYQTDQQAQGYALGILRDLAERDEPVDNSVFRLRALPRPDSLPRHLTEEESQRLEVFLLARLTSVFPKVRLENACLFVLLHSGLRRGECVDVRFQDLDWAGKRLVVRQGTLRHPTVPLWLYPHRLRHTCATRLLNAGMDFTRIQKLLGHEHISTTLIYARVQDATVEADYRQALGRIERQQMPLSDLPIVVDNWPTQVVKVQEPLDNSV